MVSIPQEKCDDNTIELMKEFSEISMACLNNANNCNNILNSLTSLNFSK